MSPVNHSDLELYRWGGGGGGVCVGGGGRGRPSLIESA